LTPSSFGPAFTLTATAVINTAQNIARKRFIKKLL
jgi:hypothetical protein